MRLESLKNLETAQSKLAKAKGTEEVKEAKKNVKKVADEYKYLKNLHYRLEVPLICGMVVPIICAFGILDIFGLIVTSGPIIFMAAALGGFIIEALSLLSLVWIHTLSKRTKAIEEQNKTGRE